uniref:Uncharacterized protein n=1 Tax=Glossina palpalis gambiensis TaxID=67801 RepID=A0A1B0BNC4_9MUSC
MLSPYHTLYKIKSNSNGDSTIANNANMCIVITLENGLNDNNIIYRNTFTKGACRTSTNTRASASACASAITFTKHKCMYSLEGLRVCLMLAAAAAAAAGAASAPSTPTAEAIVMVVVVEVVVQTIWKLVRLAFSWLFDVSPLVSRLMVCVTKRKTMLNIENQNKPLKKYAAFKEMRSLFNDIYYIYTILYYRTYSDYNCYK